jgi:hypothetical protein
MIYLMHVFLLLHFRQVGQTILFLPTLGSSETAFIFDFYILNGEMSMTPFHRFDLPVIYGGLKERISVS